VPEVSPPEAAFKKTFDSNPIDKAYADEMDQAATTVAMVGIAGKFSEIWSVEVGIANKKATQSLTGTALDAYKAGQKAWSDKKQAALDKIQKDVMQEYEGGSMAAVALSEQTMAFYRSRVYQIYLAVYLETGTLPKLTYNGENE